MLVMGNPRPIPEAGPTGELGDRSKLVLVVGLKFETS